MKQAETSALTGKNKVGDSFRLEQSNQLSGKPTQPLVVTPIIVSSMEEDLKMGMNLQYLILQSSNVSLYIISGYRLPTNSYFFLVLWIFLFYGVCH